MAMTNGRQRQLNEYIIEAQERYKRDGFAWGVFDCVAFAGDWARLVLGTDPLEAYRGRYQSTAEAFALLSKIDGTLLDALSRRFGEPIHPSQAHRGDIAYRIADSACGIYFTSGARMQALFLGEGGFVLQRARDTDHAFRVG